MDAREGTSATDLVKTIYLEIIMEQLDIFDNIDLADVSTKEDDPVVQNTVILYTPNGSAVSATDMRNITDWTRSEKDALNAYYSTAYPGANRLSDPTKKYRGMQH